MAERALGRRELLRRIAVLVALGACRRASDDHASKGTVARSQEQEPLTSMHGKNCLVTGATSGMGEVTARELARRGAMVIVAGRNAAACEACAAAIRRDTGARVETAVADLGSLAQVRRMAQDVAARLDHLDVLVNNAGGYQFERTLTEDGFEKTFAVNYLSHFLLTNLLLDRLRSSPSARVVNVTSSAHWDGQIEFDNLQGELRYERLDAYARSKLALLLFTYELSRRLAGTHVTANAVHPGTVATNLGSDAGFVRGWLRVRVRNLVKRSSMLTPEQGARWILHAATAPELQDVTGQYLDQGNAVRSSPASYDVALAARLWRKSEELTGATGR